MIINLNQFGNSGGGSGTGSVVSWEQEVTAGTQIAQITINGTTQDVYAPEGGDEDAQEVISTALNDLNERNGELLKELDTLPENPVDGAVYNYQGHLVKYVEGAGNWGEWIGPKNVLSNGSYSDINCKNPVASLVYAAIPSSMNEKLLTGLAGGGHFFYFDLDNNQILDYDSSGSTRNLLYTISKDGPEIYCDGAFNQRIYVQWKGNRITFRPGNTYTNLNNSYCSTSTFSSHYELADSGINNPTPDDTLSPNQSYSVYLDNNGRVTARGSSIVKEWKKINGTNYLTIQSPGSNIPAFYAPTASGATGTVLVSAGDTVPVWQSLSTALGIQHIWTGTQDAYDALGTYDNSTLYFIVEEE